MTTERVVEYTCGFLQFTVEEHRNVIWLYNPKDHQKWALKIGFVLVIPNESNRSAAERFGTNIITVGDDFTHISILVNKVFKQKNKDKIW